MLIPGQSVSHKSWRFGMAVVSRPQEAAHLARPEDIHDQIAIEYNIKGSAELFCCLT